MEQWWWFTLHSHLKHNTHITKCSIYRYNTCGGYTMSYGTTQQQLNNWTVNNYFSMSVFHSGSKIHLSRKTWRFNLGRHTPSDYTWGPLEKEWTREMYNEKMASFSSIEYMHHTIISSSFLPRPGRLYIKERFLSTIENRTPEHKGTRTRISGGLRERVLLRRSPIMWAPSMLDIASMLKLCMPIFNVNKCSSEWMIFFAWKLWTRKWGLIYCTCILVS